MPPALAQVAWPYQNYTQPVGLGRPASLQAPLAGPEGKRS